MNPTLLQVNPRSLLSELKMPPTLDSLTAYHLRALIPPGFDWVWMLGVWQTGEAGRTIARNHPDLQSEFMHTLRDFVPSDVCGSPFAVHAYTVHGELGGDAALLRLREKLHNQGIKLLLDLVPNHVAIDHPWSREHPEYFIHGTEDDLAREPYNWVRVNNSHILAHGKDPYFYGWSDTLQLNYASPTLHDAMSKEIHRITTLCDGLRCDMAMLVLPEVFSRTWQHAMPSQNQASCFWSRIIGEVKAANPDFLFMAEVYWNLEHEVLKRGFDFAYDKVLLDRLVRRDGQEIRNHLKSEYHHQKKLARFLENHDEPRAGGIFSPAEHQAAAVVTYLSPGLKFFHHGQFDGHRVKLPVQLGRAPREASDPAVRALYDRLLPIATSNVSTHGQWELLDCSPAWQGNTTFDRITTFMLDDGKERLLVAVNLSDNQAQCFTHLPSCVRQEQGTFNSVRLTDLLSNISYERPIADLLTRGLYLDLTPWQAHIFRWEYLR